MSKFNKSLKFFVFSSCLILVNISCTDDFFEKQSNNKITPDQHYETLKEVEVAYEGAFSLMQETMINMVVMDGLRTDMMEITDWSPNEMKEINDLEISNNNPITDPANFYKIIVNTNEILARIDSVTNKDEDFDEYELFRFKGYLIALRAWSYFNIARLYGEAVYIDDNLEKYSSGQSFKKYDRKTMIDMLIKQVREYAVDKEDFYNTKVINKMALLAEMFIEINEYDSTLYYASAAINLYGRTEGYYLIKDVYEEEKWKDIFIESSGKELEVLTAVPFSLTDNQRNILEEYFEDYYYIKPTNVIIELFEKQLNNRNRQTGDLYRGLGISYDTIRNSDEKWISKYSLATGKGYSSDIIVMRAADLNLIMAEALNRMGDMSTALILLNRGFSTKTSAAKGTFRGWNENIGIRGRVLLGQIDTLDVEFDANTRMLALEDSIIRERAMEMAFEGKRWFDLVRIARRRNDPAYLANKVAAKFDDSAKANEIRAKLMTTANWYLPKDF